MFELVEEKYTWCPLGLSHVPNAETIASIEASEKGKGVKSFNSMDALFKDLGILTLPTNFDCFSIEQPQEK